MDKILFIAGQRIIEHLEKLYYKQKKRALDKMIMVENIYFGSSMLELPYYGLEIELCCCSNPMKNQVSPSTH